MQKEHTQFPSRYTIGEQVLVNLTGGIANSESSESAEITSSNYLTPAVIRTVTFTKGKVRYSVILGFDTDMPHTVHNIDSILVSDYYDAAGNIIIHDLPFDNYS